MIVIGGLAAHIDHGVDRRRAADHLAARIIQAAAVETFLGLGLEAPIGARIANGEQIANWNMKPDPVVAAAGLEDEYALAGICGQAVGEDAAGRAGAGDDVVVVAVDRLNSRHFALHTIMRADQSFSAITAGIIARSGPETRSATSTTLSASGRQPIVDPRPMARWARAINARNDGS